MGQLNFGEIHANHLLKQVREAGCHELHLRVGQPPYTDICDENALDILSGYEDMAHVDVQQMVYALLTDEQIRHLEREGEIDLPYNLSHQATFDVHVLYSRHSIEAHFIAQPNPANQ